MENLMGLLRITVLRGINLAVRDARSSDPYVTVTMAKQIVRTRAVKKNVNPEWKEELTLSITDPNLPIGLHVYDKDTFSLDDKMGEAELDIKAFVEALKMRTESTNVPNGTIITKLKPNRKNCLSEESDIIWENGKVIQHIFSDLETLSAVK